MVEKKCDYCDKVFCGSDKQIERMMLMHKIAAHRNKIKITEAKNGD